MMCRLFQLLLFLGLAAGPGCHHVSGGGSSGNTDADSGTSTDTGTDADTDTDTDADSDPSGGYQWHTFYGSSNYDLGSSIAADGGGNLYLTGKSDSSWDGPGGESPLHAYSGGDDIFILKLDSSGAYQWHTFYGSSIGESGDSGYSIAADGSGDLYLTGQSYSSWDGPGGESPLHAHSGGNDIFILKLDSSGVYQWHTFYGSNGLTGYYDSGQSILVQESGNVYGTGFSDATWDGPGGESPLHAHSGGGDVFVLKLVN